MAEHETGVILLVLGIVFIALGIFVWPLCGVGILLLIIGIVMIATQPSAPAYYPGYAYPQYSTPSGATPAAVCPVCGGPLTWVPQYGRWYCYRCQAYR